MYSSYSSGISMWGGLGIIAFVFAIAATVLTLIFIVPSKRRAALPKFFQVVHDIVNFKGLMIEIILKAIYIFATVYVFLMGFFNLFNFSYLYGYTLLGSILTMVFGPIVVRLIFEVLMMFVLLVKNTIQINNKLESKNDGKNDGKNDDPFINQIDSLKNEYSAPVQKPADTQPAGGAPAQPVKFCTHCGTQLSGDTQFCPNCGKKC